MEDQRSCRLTRKLTASRHDTPFRILLNLNMAAMRFRVEPAVAQPAAG